MNTARWDPFRSLPGFDRFLGAGFSSGAADYRPAVDVFERDDVLVFRVEVPGVDRDAIHVDVENDVLTIRGSRQREADVKDGSAYRIERASGSFTRSFRLPRGLDTSKVTAVHRNGLLEISVPRADEARSRKIAVEAA